MTEKTLKRRRRQAGFSLTEILVVVFIIGLLTVSVGTYALSAMQGAQADTTRTRLAQVEAALDQYALIAFRYPSSEEGLQALVTMPEGFPNPAAYPKSGFLRRMPNDGWDRPFNYRSPATKSRFEYDLYSLGADGEEGGEDLDADIGNWDPATTP